MQYSKDLHNLLEWVSDASSIATIETPEEKPLHPWRKQVQQQTYK